MKHFMDFDLIAEENCLAEVVGSDSLSDKVDDAMRMKNHCKLLSDNLAPAVLKTEIKCLVATQHRKAKTNDVELRKSIVQRAKEQQHRHLTQHEDQAGPKKIDVERKETNPTTKPNREQQTMPPRGACLVCKVPQRMSDCPSACEEDKIAARQ